MEYYFGIFQNIGFHTLLGLSAYLLLLTGQLSMAQVGFFAIGAYASGILTVIYGMNIFSALGSGAVISSFFAFLVGFPALRIKGLMLVIATIAFSEIVRHFCLIGRFSYRMLPAINLWLPLILKLFLQHL